ncbi:MAG: WD40 repeat-like protein [Planctomycetota bacterium]|nr:MAG: WD40 repeat-like protein [Planctomycetota bacterium]
MPLNRREFVGLGAVSVLGGWSNVGFSADESKAKPSDPRELTVVVMDPLAAPLSCPCVEGYAQRDYTKLAAFLESRLDRPVKVVFSESLTTALKNKTDGKADLVIGKASVVRFDAVANKRSLKPIAQLSGKDGVTTQTGLIVVPSADPAKAVADLKSYRVIFGPVESDEKHAAALALLKKHDVEAPKKIETCGGCDEGCHKILEAGKDSRGAAVISSYARPLLEGCGQVKKGDLRVIGETSPVPFIVAFADERLDSGLKKSLEESLLAVANDAKLCLQLETLLGFVAVEDESLLAGKKKSVTSR